MGQADSSQIQQSAKSLQQQHIITNSQFQSFIKDYHNHQLITQDVRTFNDNQLKHFLKYFLMHSYPSQNSKNQKILQKQQKNLKEKHISQNQMPSISTEIYINFQVNGKNILEEQDQSQHIRNHQLLKGSNHFMKVIKVNSNNLSNFQHKNIKDQQYLESIIYSVNFNVLQLEQKPDELRDIVIKMFYQTEYFKKNKIINKNLKNNNSKLKLFLAELENGYHEKNNKFHNFLHGVNVMHNTFLIVNRDQQFDKENSTQKQNGRIDGFLSQFAKFALIFSSLCHDVGHTGYNNSFEIVSQSKLASRFNDVSPLQNYHIQRTLQLLKWEKTNFLDFFSKEQSVKFRKYIISNILFTDIKEHFILLKKFEEEFKPNTKTINFENQKILCGMIIHSSDFAGSIKQFQISKEWSRRVNEEFKSQSIKEGELGLPLTPFLLNLDNPLVLAKNQAGFLKIFVLPLYKSLSEFEQSNYNIQAMYMQINSNIKNQQAHLKVLEDDNQTKTQLKI